MTVKLVLKAFGQAFLGLVLVNLIYFIVSLITTDFINSWNIAFKHGAFEINDKIVGLKLWTSDANKLMISIFSVALYLGYKKQKLTNKA